MIIDIHPSGGFFLDVPGIFPGSSRVEIDAHGVPHRVVAQTRAPEPVVETQPAPKPARKPRRITRS